MAKLFLALCAFALFVAVAVAQPIDEDVDIDVDFDGDLEDENQRGIKSVSHENFYNFFFGSFQ